MHEARHASGGLANDRVENRASKVLFLPYVPLNSRCYVYGNAMYLDRRNRCLQGVLGDGEDGRR